MALRWISVHVVLWSFSWSFSGNVRASPCAEVHTPSAVVLSGSQVTASCIINEDCLLTKGQHFHVNWPYEATVNYSKMTNQNTSIHEVLISNFTNTRATLECAICLQDDCNVVGGVTIQAAYPPPVPQNLNCQLNLTAPYLLKCTWDPGQDMSSIPTKYSLYIKISGTASMPRKFVPEPGKYFVSVPREGFSLFSEVQVHVVAVNALGQATSESLELNPMETAKLDAPTIQRVRTGRPGCLKFEWILSESQKWIMKTFNVEIRLKPMISKTLDKEQVFFKKSRPGNEVEVSGLFHGMMYQTKMRMGYSSSPWSEWSHPTVATTLIKAPTGRLITWLKLLGQPTRKQQRAELFWKPSLQFRANSMNISYTVLLMKSPSRKKTVCVTEQQHCSFQIPVDVRKIHLTANNAAGQSSPTEVTVHRHAEGDPVRYLKVFPESEESLMTKWLSPESTAITAYVLEWKTLQGANLTTVSFEIIDKNQSSLVVSGLEPYKPYEFSIYPKYKNGTGQPCTIMAYTRQKAPSESPKLNFGEIRPSYIELLWDEIPLNQKNGIITGYRVFYWNEMNNTGVLDIVGTERHVALKNLSPNSIYSILLMTSTEGGSLNGSVASVKTSSIDALEIVLIVIPACVGLVLLFLGGITCFSNNKWFKKRFWPIIPDPANSSIKKWVSVDSLQDFPSFNEAKDPVLVYLSHFSLLSLSEKDLCKGNPTTSEYLHCSNWSYDEKSINGEQSDSSRDSGMYNSESTTESVPYATVVFGNPYRTQSRPQPTYLRSESTQPLLGEEEPSSPPPYNKPSSEEQLSEVNHFSPLQEDLSSEEEAGTLWEDFPMLQSLEIKVNEEA